MQSEDVRRVLLVGSGTMGLQIGLQAATHGFEVALYETDAAARETAPGRLRGYARAAAGRRAPGHRRAREPHSPG